MSVTLIIIILTALISYAAFSNDNVYNKLILWPRRMDNPAEYYRLLTSGFIHADWPHLIFNMLALYFFGENVEQYFAYLGKPILYPLLYILGIITASLPSFAKHRNNGYYRSLGASGGVAAILFAFVYMAPWAVIYVWFIPIPAIIGAVLYLAYSAYMSRQGGDNVNHDAHFWGAVFGFLFTLVFDPTHGRIFFDQIVRPSFNI
jgi:membrane associated rhomboid family serine protease